MKREHLAVLSLPLGDLIVDEEDGAGRILRARIDDPHRGPVRIRDGIVYFPLAVSGRDDPLQKELDYQTETGHSYRANPVFLDDDFIAAMPDSMAVHKPHTINFAIDFPALVAEVDIARRSYVLDVGTGACWSTRMLAAVSDHVFAVDVTDDPHCGLGAGEIQFRHHGCYFERVLARMEDLPFRADVFDFAFFNASFHHTADMEKTLSELGRVLVPDGRVYLVNEETRLVGRSAVNHSEFEGGHHDLDVEWLTRAARRHGFAVTHRIPEHHRRRPLLGRCMEAAVGWLPWHYFVNTIICLHKTG